jgi:hypothetical protein
VKKKTNIEFKFLGRKPIDNKKEFKGKKEITNPIRSIATSM